MALVIRVGDEKLELWRQTLQQALPELLCYGWDECFDPHCIDYAVVWQPPHSGLRRFPNLRAVFSIGAGVDHIFSDPHLPPVPVMRLAGTELTQRMVEYVTWQALNCLRRQTELAAQQRRRHWEPLSTTLASDWTVGVMGLGLMGQAAAKALATIGFQVRGWARSAKALPGVRSYAGEAALDDFVAGCQIVVCLLPLTQQTTGILNRRLFAQLPQQAWVINAGRGEHLVETDVLAALDAQHLAGAVLDVFHEEPLPQDHPFWAHPQITVTPHIASRIDPIIGCRLLAANIRRFIAGDPLAALQVNPQRGY